MIELRTPPARHRRRAVALTAVAALVSTASALAIGVPAQAAFTGAPLLNKLSNTCLDVRGAVNTPGTPVDIFTCNGGANQKFTTTAAGQIQVTINGATNCLDAYDSGTGNGTKIIIWPCHTGSNQKWTHNADNSLRGTASGRCIDIYGSAPNNGNNAVLWDCKNGGNGSQTWTPNGVPPVLPGGSAKAAPYLYLGWGNPPSATSVMSSTGTKSFTLAFVLSGGGCTPAWDGSRGLKGGNDEQTINAIKAAGGSIVPSFGGYGGGPNGKLGPACGSADALANAYLQVVDAYGLKSVDVDIEASDEFESEAVQDRILDALKLVKQRRPGTQTILTFGTSTTGPTWWGSRLVTQAKARGADIDIFTQMPFDFAGGDMYTSTVNATEGLRNLLKTTFGWSDDTAYRHMGISGMNGVSDQQEMTSLDTWTRIRDWAAARHLARFTYWSVNRDRPCAAGTLSNECSGTSTAAWEFTRVTAGYTG
jgi:hypothetical protein